MALTPSQNRRSIKAKHRWKPLQGTFPLTVNFDFTKEALKQVITVG